MYVPRHFAETDAERVRAFIRAHPFGILVTAGAAEPIATHLPFMLDEPGPDAPHGVLYAHLARANPHGRLLADAAPDAPPSMVIFNGAHAYVSPRWYAPGDAVPTWNYLAVHAYGRPAIVEGDAKRALADRLVAQYEGTAWQLADRDPDFVRRQLAGTTAFAMPIDRLDAKAKLSQNRAAEDRTAVAAALSQSDRPDERATAEAMRDTQEETGR